MKYEALDDAMRTRAELRTHHAIAVQMLRVGKLRHNVDRVALAATVIASVKCHLQSIETELREIEL